MRRLKVRFRLNPGGIGAPLDKLGDIAKEAERFLRMLANDVHLEVKKGEWLAVKFQNESVSFDAEFQGFASDSATQSYMEALDRITIFDPEQAIVPAPVRESTLLQYAKIGNLIDPDELLLIGFYNGSDDEPKEWRDVTYSQAARIRRAIETPLTSYGSVQGVIHSLFKEGGYFQLRELATQQLVRCIFPRAFYAKVHDALRDRFAVINVAGPITLDRSTRSIQELTVERLDIAESLSEEEFERFFGCAPEMTGTKSTEDYIEGLRGDDD